jgi:hypothetical protein
VGKDASFSLDIEAPAALSLDQNSNPVVSGITMNSQYSRSAQITIDADGVFDDYNWALLFGGYGTLTYSPTCSH